MSPVLPVRLAGDAFARGRAQAEAEPAMAAAVREAVALRLDRAGAVRGTKRARAFLDRQREATTRLAPEALAEIAGIGAGFAVADSDLFTFLHLSVLADLAAAPDDGADGCTAWAARRPDGGAILGKNRDFKPEHAALQRLFLHADPAWGGRRVLCLGSLGAPGAYSSGINSDGLALADTQIGTADHGPGILRYFLMSKLLAECANVAEALAMIGRLPHAGGGSLMLADAGGDIAAVALRHGRIEIDRGEAAGGQWVAHTNHYRRHPDAIPGAPDSQARLGAIEGFLARGLGGEPIAAAKAAMASRAPVALCKRLGPDSPDSATLATTLYLTANGDTWLADGAPDAVPWRRFVAHAREGWRETPEGA
ncbi:MAG: hypothetical protein IT557_07855 [Alphaproteobacteria bacterium]|nr:hypothetical protein [Alphaproteobacteria bacterium]